MRGILLALLLLVMTHGTSAPSKFDIIFHLKKYGHTDIAICTDPKQVCRWAAAVGSGAVIVCIYVVPPRLIYDSVVGGNIQLR
jgi:hypothetical protein